MRKLLLIIIWLVSLSIVTFSRPVRPVQALVSQPDGSTFSIVFYGDEFHKVRETPEGFSVVQDGDGWWFYAVADEDGKLVSSGVKVGQGNPPASSFAARAVSDKRQRFNQLQMESENIMNILRRQNPSTKAGNPVVKHGLVLLAQFTDVKFKYTKDDFVKMLTQEGYSVGGATGSAKEYFEEQFGSGYQFDFYVSEILTVSQKRSYYGGNNSSGSDKAPEEMVIEACREADAKGLDFAPFDQDGDGVVDNVFVIFAGDDEADYASGHSDCIWSHAWYIYSGAGKSLFLDGKRIDRYACTSELMPTSYSNTTITGIGTFCHEYSHTLGLPDLYDTDYEESGGVSASTWNILSLMDGGNSNNSGNTPPYFNAIDREIMGIGNPVTITSDGRYTLKPINEQGQIYRLDTDTNNEYFLLECRSDSGWDKYIGGKGMIIYHIDKSTRRVGSITATNRWSEQYNEVNTYPTHQCADLVEADKRTDIFSSWESYSSALRNSLSGLFYPSGGTSYELSFWSGAASDIKITDITKSGDDVSFNVTGLSKEPIPPAAIKPVCDRFQDAAIVTFESEDPACMLSASVSWGASQAALCEPVIVAPYEPGHYALLIEGLDSGTYYNVKMSIVSDSGLTGTAATSNFITSRKNTFPSSINLKSVSRVNGSESAFPTGVGFPLRVDNASDAEKIEWYFNSKKVSVDASCYFHPDKSGIMKAIIYRPDGSKDVLVKKINLVSNVEIE